DTTAQIRVRGAFVLLIGFVAIAENVGLETILGAFAAGALLSLIDRDQTMTHPQFRLKLEAAGFGIFIPVFFVTTGIRFDLNALFSSVSTVARIPLFLLALLLVRGLPALLYSSLIGRRKALIAGLLQATSSGARSSHPSSTRCSAAAAPRRRSRASTPSRRTTAPTAARPAGTSCSARMRSSSPARVGRASPRRPSPRTSSCWPTTATA